MESAVTGKFLVRSEQGYYDEEAGKPARVSHTVRKEKENDEDEKAVPGFGMHISCGDVIFDFRICRKG